jgi:hypothetical protein
VDQLTGSAFWGDSMRGQTAAAIATLLAGLPLWFLTWRPMQVEALSKNDLGDHARRSLVRRSYLYFVIFVAVLGLMGSAIALMYNLLTFALGSRNENIASNLLNSIQLLVLFGGLLLYHFSTLRQDNALAVATLNSRQARFGVMVFEPGNPALVEALTAAVKKSSPGIPLVFLTVGDPIPEEARDAQAVVLTTALALNPPEALRLWLESYEGEKIVLASEAPGWILSGQPQRSLNASTQQAAAVLRQLAEGQEVRPASVSSAGMIVLYIVAVFFGLQIVFFLITLLLSAFIG